MIDKDKPDIIIKALKDGKKKAFDEVYKTYYKRLCHYLLNFTQDQAKIEDIVQETFITLWDKRKSLNIKKSPESYLFRTAHNKFMDTYRKKKQTNSFLIDYYYTALIRAEKKDQSYKKELLKKLKNCIDTLPDRCQKVFKECKLSQKTNQEVADELDISIKTVEKHVSTGYRLIRECVDQEEW